MHNSIIDTIGNTPIINLTPNSSQKLLLKCEYLNPFFSIKDRAAKAMIYSLLNRGIIDHNTTLIEATSGNTGIALAAIGAALKIKLIVVMPSSASLERQKIIRHLGASLELTDPNLGMQGAIDRATALNKAISNSYIIDQFNNPSNSKAHYDTTAKEILEQTKGKLDYLVAGVGTSGTLSGTAKALKEHLPNLKVIAVEPAQSAVLSGKSAAVHKIEGIGAGFTPALYDPSLVDEVLCIDEKEAIVCAKHLSAEFGILAGISSGANYAAMLNIAQRDKTKEAAILSFAVDSAERYLSTQLFA